MPSPGDTVGHYVVEAEIGEGGMGTVYRARDEKLDRRVALKVVRDDETDPGKLREKHERLLREARAAAAFSHPNAVGIFDVGEDASGRAFIAMELVSGRSLRDAMADAGVPLSRRVRWLIDVARALDAAHRAGLVHRDVKPENVMVTDDGAVKVLDFGIARRASRDVDPSGPTEARGLGTLTAEGVSVGTPMYMAPEQIHGRSLDGRSDQFAWGVLAYEVLSGRVPWNTRGDTLALVGSILTDEVKPHETVPEAIDAVVRRALAKSADARFGSMAEVAGALESALEARGAERSEPGRGGLGGAAPHRDGGLEARFTSAAPGAPSVPASAPRSVATLDRRRYSDTEMQQILQLALERQAEEEGVKMVDLRAAAREVGIADADLDEAAREIDKRRKKDAKEGAREPDASEEEDGPGRRWRRFLRHVAVYAVVNTFVYLMTGGAWQRWMLLGWGLGLALHGVNTVFPKEKKRRGKKKKREATPLVEEGAHLLIETAKLRVATPATPASPAEPARVRVVDPRAEEAAASSEGRRQRRERR